MFHGRGINRISSGAEEKAGFPDWRKMDCRERKAAAQDGCLSSFPVGRFLFQSIAAMPGNAWLFILLAVLSSRGERLREWSGFFEYPGTVSIGEIMKILFT